MADAGLGVAQLLCRRRNRACLRHAEEYNVTFDVHKQAFQSVMFNISIMNFFICEFMLKLSLQEFALLDRCGMKRRLSQKKADSMLPLPCGKVSRNKIQEEFYVSQRKGSSGIYPGQRNPLCRF
jgi:hypothetical protein